MSSLDGINSLDCKILQYKYSIYKAEKFVEYLNTISIIEETPKLRLCHYLTLLSGNLFAINEGIFNNKLELLSQFRLVKVNPVNVSPVVSHIPYDTNDINVNLLTNLPTVETSTKCIKILLTLYSNCIDGYKKRLQQALSERGQVKVNDDDLQKFDELVSSTFNSVSDIDLVGSPDLSFDLTQDKTLLSDGTFMEATLIDIDVKMIFVIIEAMKSSLNHLKTFIDKFKSLKTKPDNLKKFKDPQYSLHRILLITLRLNDLYIVFRRFGRKIYLSNFSHLNDQKFLMITNNSYYFKGTVLRAIDEIFNQTKKNGVLIANLTRLIRANSKFEANAKNILDFNNFIGQGHMIISNIIIKFEEFGKLWVQSELKFRKTYNLPKFYILEIYNRVQRDENLKIKASNRLRAEQQSKIEAFPSIDEAYMDKTKKQDTSDQSSATSREKSIFNRPSRSSSVSSNSSIPSITLNRKSSISSVNSSTAKANTTTRSVNGRQQRPSSMIFLNNNGSNSSLSKPQPSSVTTRGRSNSQPLSPESLAKLLLNGSSFLPNSSINSNTSTQSPGASPLNSRIASSGAAAALKQNSIGLSPSNSIKINSQISPSNSIKRKPSVTRSTMASKNSPNKVQPIIEEETKKLSANQRLQKHLQEAARSGSLMTQEKEVLTSVVFDPNDPTAINLKRYSDKKDTSSSNGMRSPFNPVTSDGSSNPIDGQKAIEANNAVNIPVPVKTKRRTRDEVTKLNTKRNSEIITLSSDSSKPSMDNASSSTDTSDGVTEIIKQVRFIGVPDYTEAEDAPTSYSAKILKNFAVFKTPGNKPGYKRKDQMLKKEESLSFKQLNHQNLLNNPRGIISPPSPAIQSKFLPSSLQNTKFKIKSKLT